MKSDPIGGYDMEALPLAGGPPLSILSSPFFEADARLSPDGRWLTYVSNASGRLDVYVRPFAQPGAERVISPGGGFGPRWRRDGRELFYIASDGRLMAVPMTPGKGLDPGPAHVLFDARLGVLPLRPGRVRQHARRPAFPRQPGGWPPCPRGGQPALRLDGEATALIFHR